MKLASFTKKLLAPMCFEGTCNIDLFNAWLKQELIPNLTHDQVLILNNASFHKSKTTRKSIEPPYSPELNPIEKYWANMKTKIRELLPTVATLSEALDQAVLLL